MKLNLTMCGLFPLLMTISMYIFNRRGDNPQSHITPLLIITALRIVHNYSLYVCLSADTDCIAFSSCHGNCAYISAVDTATVPMPQLLAWQLCLHFSSCWHGEYACVSAAVDGKCAASQQLLTATVLRLSSCHGNCAASQQLSRQLCLRLSSCHGNCAYVSATVMVTVPTSQQLSW